jgi:choline dehydrogenase-like flavoprotein
MASPTTAHPIGTAAMAPRELGGVVGPDLTVYGTRKLSVADNSIIPLIPSTHTSSTAYAIGEKVKNQPLGYTFWSQAHDLTCSQAADLILRRALKA